MFHGLNASLNLALVLVVRSELPLFSHNLPTGIFPLLTSLSTGVICDYDFGCSNLSDIVLISPMGVGLSLHTSHKEKVRKNVTKDLHAQVSSY